jgi:uncharacterized protein (TIGR00369 family)
MLRFVAELETRAASAAAPERRRDITWDDPSVGAALALKLSGLDFLRAIADGRIPPPPIASLLGMNIARIEPGRVSFTLDIGEHLYNPIGSVHGGVCCTLLDSAMGCAVHTTLPVGLAYTTLELTVNLVRALTTRTPKVVAEGEVITSGRRVAARRAGRRGRQYAPGSVRQPCPAFSLVFFAEPLNCCPRLMKLCL